MFAVCFNSSARRSGKSAGNVPAPVSPTPAATGEMENVKRSFDMEVIKSDI